MQAEFKRGVCVPLVGKAKEGSGGKGGGQDGGKGGRRGEGGGEKGTDGGREGRANLWCVER